ncbi:hydrogenase expression/formation protein HupK [Acidimangrovimonas sediminis]|uniref:hydrogenase expression/formation protein HupK n=1 Tax=Acidimangrovimonas sediminis TaxID=2056283 RepID=UPI0011AF7568|nr:hydrogenase expression/formation protein HupK [Acidimangrovimonas sediminis]
MFDGIEITIAEEGGKLAARVRPAPALPLARLIAGKSPEEAATLLPRLFSLCRSAQEAAARLSLGLDPGDSAAALHRELLRDHLLKLGLTWPQLLGLPPAPLPRPGTEAEALFGPARHLPDTPAALARWRAEGTGAAPLLAALDRAFAPGEAVANLAPVTDDTALAAAPVENSPGLRHAAHPLLRAIEASHGRGPLWRALGRLADVEAALAGRLPAPRRLPDGTALAAAARGLYALRLDTEGGRVTGLTRRTPTDHMLAPGGMLDQSIATLSATKRPLAALVVDLLDPCVACTLKETRDA